MSERSEERLRNQQLLGVVRRVRRRWRLKVALRGLTILAAAGLLVFLVSAFGMEAFQFTPGAVTGFRLGSYALLAILAVRFLILPLARNVDEERVALYLEEHEPELEARVLSALEVARAREEGEGSAARTASVVSPALARGVVESAIERCREIDFGRRIERGSLQRSGGVLAGTAVLSLAFFLLGPAYLRHGISTLLVPSRSAEEASPYSIEVQPGDVTVARGSDQVVRAATVGFDADAVDVLWRRSEGASFEPQPMIGDGEGGYEVLLLDLDEPTEYFVRSGAVRSPVYRIEVADLPTVRTLMLEYRFPDYTGLEPRTVENGGDVAAVRGTLVRLVATPTLGVPGGRLILDDSSSVPLRLQEDGTLTGTLEVTRDGFYQIELDRNGGEPVKGSPVYTIDVLSDQPPSVSFTQPGRDTRASAIEEVFVEATADDDFGVGELVLAFSVNGGPEERVSLFSGGPSPMREVTAGHTFFLEEYGLEPGDIVSYHAEVTDNQPGGGGRTITSDIYFLDIRPFRQDFRQADTRGQPQGGAGGGPEVQLSRRQREIVAGTFNLDRDRERYTDRELRANVTLLSTSQAQLREQVRTLLDRMGIRTQLSSDDDFRRMAEALEAAATAMEEAEARLEEGEIEDALPPEQRALQHLLRAEAVFREIQVGTGSGGGGGGQGAAAEDLVDLYELELDKLRNQYETVQRGRQQEVDEELDEARERLRELARRQQQELERQRRRAESLPGAQSGGGGSQRQLADETEEAARQLERLARETGDRSLQETARDLQEAADAMRRSAADPGARGSGQAGQALDRLEEAERRLRRARQDRLETQLDDALRRGRSLARRQEEISREVRDLPDTGAQRAEQVRRILERKDQMEQEVADLERSLDELAADSRASQREASRRMKDAADGIREDKIKEKVRYSKAVVSGRAPDFAADFEDQIQADLERLAQGIEEAAGAVGESEEDRSAEALQRTRQLLRSMESLDRRMDEAAREGSEGEPGEEEGEASDRGLDRRGQEGREGDAQEGGSAQGQAEREGDGQGQGRRGLDRAGGRFGPGGGTPGRPGTLTPDDVRQFRRELQERRDETGELREELEGLGFDAEDLEGIIRAMRALDDPRVYDDPEEVERLRRAIVEELKSFEYALRRQMEEEGSERLFLSGSDDVPEGFRSLVEEYYRALAREEGGG